MSQNVSVELSFYAV